MFVLIFIGFSFFLSVLSSPRSNALADAAFTQLVKASPVPTAKAHPRRAVSACKNEI
jgi:hypothetical protein